MKSINYQEVPSTIAEDFNKQKTVWENGKLKSLDEGPYITMYIGHHNETAYDEEGREKTVTMAFPVRVKKPYTIDKAIDSALKQAYSVSDTNVLMLSANDTKKAEITAFTEWVRNELSDMTELDKAKQLKISEINAYDTSSAVNGFTYKGQFMWLSREDRTALQDRFSREIAKGVETTNLFYEGFAINITPQEGLALVNSVADYADQCFDNTQKNRAKVNAAMSVEEINNIDITQGYPEKLAL